MSGKIRGILIFLCIVGILLNSQCIPAIAYSANDTVDLRVKSETTGNVFFDGDIPSLSIFLTNLTSESKNFTLTYKLYKNEADGSVTDFGKTEDTETLQGGESIKRMFEKENLEYGIYNLEVTVFDMSGRKLSTVKTEFSKVIRNDKQNSGHGVCVHLVRMGNAETELAFAKNAGFSMVRDDFTWGEYELIKGDKKLSFRHKNFLKKAAKYNLDVLAIVGGDNGYYYGEGEQSNLPVNITEFKNFIGSLLDEDEFKNIKRIEVQNEPQGSYVDYVTGLQNIEKLVPEYAEELVAASDIIREKRPDVEIGAFSVCLMNKKQTDDYINGVYDYLAKNYMGKDKIFDTLTIHPYSVRSDKAKDIGETVEYYKSVAEEKGFDKENTDIWCTEYGKATTDTVSQTEQAKSIIRDYADIKSNRYTDDVYVYDMADDSGTFGLIKHNSNAEVPYAAKFSYLAVSALNKMTGEAQACTKTKDENNLFDVYDFSYADKDINVYMIYPKAENKSESFKYDFGAGELKYYDIFGNETDRDKCEQYFNSAIPYYVMRNKEIEPAEDKSFTVSGKIKSGDAGKKVSLTVLDEKTLFDENMYGNIKYAEQKVSDVDGSFKFKFDVEDKSNNFIGYVVSEDDNTPLKFMLKGDIKALQLFSGTTEINSLNLNLLDLSRASVKINFSQTNADNQSDFKLICVFYNNGVPNCIKICDSDGGDTYDVSVSQNVDYDFIKIYMFDSLTKCVPLCSATMIGQNRI